MKIQIYEQADVSSSESDLDMMLEYAIESLKAKGVTVERYDKLASDPAVFEKIEGYALPVIVVDGEILCAGSYDFTLLDNWKLNRILNEKEGCACQDAGAGCASCPKNKTCKSKI